MYKRFHPFSECKRLVEDSILVIDDIVRGREQYTISQILQFSVEVVMTWWWEIYYKSKSKSTSRKSQISP